MHILHAIILGIVEGITEFLPISSTAHLEIAAQLMNLAQSDFVKSFEIIIQLGAILAVLVLYAKKIFSHRALWRPILAAFIPTAIIGFVLYKLIKSYLIGNSWIVVFTLALGGIVLIFFERFERSNPLTPLDSTEELSGMKTSTAVYIGLAQAIAVIPGVSRSAATIVAGRLLGVSRVAIVEFSFLLAIPTMIAATGYDLLKSAHGFSGNQFGMLAVGFIIAFISALFAVRFLLNYIKSHSFKSFGIYRIVVAILFAAYLFMH